MPEPAADVPSRVPGSRTRPQPLPLSSSPTVAAVRAAPEPDRTALAQAVWERARSEGTPLVEPDPDGDARHRVVTFLARVDAGDDREVLLQANRLTDPARPRATLLERVPGTDLAAVSLRMRSDWRASYQLTRHAPGTVPEVGPFTPADLRRHRATGETDPLARRQLPARKAMAASSVVELPDAPPQRWREPREEVVPGAVTTRDLTDARGRCFRVHVHVPAGGVPQDGHVLLLLDGEVWGGQLPIAPTLDNLVADGRVPPTVSLLVEAEDESARWRDYAGSVTFLAFLAERVLPLATGVAGVRPAPARTTLAGQSLGGVFALWAGMVAPDVVGSVVAQSPSLWWRGPGTGPFRPDEAGGRVEWLTELARLQPPAGVRVHLEVGLQEWMLLEPARRLRDVLVERDIDLRYLEFNGGHDHACWWGGLADALAELHA